MHRHSLEDAIEQANMIIAAAENWSTVYTEHTDSHAKIIRVEAKLERMLRQHFRELAKDRIWKFINWTNYHNESIKAYDINIIFNDDGFDDDESSALLTVVHDPLLAGMGAGISAGQAIYNRDIGLTSSDAAVMKAAGKYSSQLVTNVTKTTRARIQQSIETSLRLGENQSAAAGRLTGIVNDPKRAGVIARTEAVNSYTQGLLSFAGESNATAKVWQALNADDECADLDGEQVGIDESFSGDGGDGPPLHPNCRCGIQLIYGNDV